MHRALPLCCVVALAVVGPLSHPATAAAQLSSVVTGDSIRVGVIGQRPQEARAVGWRADSLVIALDGVSDPWVLHREHIRSLARYQALTPQQGFRRRAGLGLVVGVFAGAAVGLALYATGVTNDPDGPPAEQLMHSVLKYTGLGTVGGMVVGGVLGGRSPGWGWVGIRLPTR